MGVFAMFENESHETFASRLRMIRYCCGLTQDTLSLAAGIDRSTLAYYESGRVFPSMSKLCLLSTLFGLSVDDLAGRDDGGPLFLEDGGGFKGKLGAGFDNGFDEEFDNGLVNGFDNGLGEEFGGEFDEEFGTAVPCDGISTSFTRLKTEEQLLVLYFRQLMEDDQNKFLNEISELAEEMQRKLIDPNDPDIILVDDLDDFIEPDI